MIGSKIFQCKRAISIKPNKNALKSNINSEWVSVCVCSKAADTTWKQDVPETMIPKCQRAGLFVEAAVSRYGMREMLGEHGTVLWVRRQGSTQRLIGLSQNKVAWRSFHWPNLGSLRIKQHNKDAYLKNETSFHNILIKISWQVYKPLQQ